MKSQSCWQGKGTLKYGGCLKSVPCYIGLVKSLKGLVAYSHSIENADVEINQLINEGMTYVLKHKLFKRLSNGEPIIIILSWIYLFLKPIN